MEAAFRIEAYRVHQKPDYGPIARHLLDKIITFYQDPENEKAYQEWLKTPEGQASLKGNRTEPIE